MSVCLLHFVIAFLCLVVMARHDLVEFTDGQVAKQTDQNQGAVLMRQFGITYTQRVFISTNFRHFR